MKPASVASHRAPARSKAQPVAEPVRAKRAVPVLSAKAEAFLDGISSGNFTLEKVLKRHEGAVSLRGTR